MQGVPFFSLSYSSAEQFQSKMSSLYKNRHHNRAREGISKVALSVKPAERTEIRATFSFSKTIRSSKAYRCAVKIHLSRRLVIKCLMEAVLIIKLEIAAECLTGFTY